MRNGIKHIFKTISLSIFMLTLSLIIENNIFNVHTHVINGRIVSHAHPFQGNSSNHTHDINGVLAIDLASVLIDGFQNVQFDFEPQLVVTNLYCKVLNRFVVDFQSLNLGRAPPVFA